MPVKLNINMERARLNPSSSFGSPSEIAAEGAFTRGQKIATLMRWRIEILGHFSATNEGMPSHATGEAEMKILNEIDDVVASLLVIDKAEHVDE
jgi:hypothetical protein